MIPARKSQLFGAFFAGHVERRITSSFARVAIFGLDEARAAVASSPILFVANHTSWWDGLVALYLSMRVLRVDAYALMNAGNLRRVPFFTRVGAFGADLTDPTDGARSIRYAAHLLDKPGRVVWVFPEGEERSPYEPLELKPGAAQIARVTGARGTRVVAVGIRYIFRGEEKPHLYISFEPVNGGAAPAREVNAGVDEQRGAIAAALARIDESLRRRDDAGATLLVQSAPGFLARLAERFLATLLPPPR